MEIGGSVGYTCSLCAFHMYVFFFSDHTNHLVRVNPLRNLPLGYLTPSPTRSSPIDLPHFYLVNIELILMDQDEHVLGGV